MIRWAIGGEELWWQATRCQKNRLQVAADLDITLDTVRSHVRSLYDKLQVLSVAEAVGRTLREGLV